MLFTPMEVFGLSAMPVLFKPPFCKWLVESNHFVESGPARLILLCKSTRQTLMIQVKEA
jgi:hypothetical protein